MIHPVLRQEFAINSKHEGTRKAWHVQVVRTDQDDLASVK